MAAKRRKSKGRRRHARARAPSSKCPMGCPVIRIKCKQAKAPKSLAERLAHYKKFKAGAGLSGFAPGSHIADQKMKAAMNRIADKWDSFARSGTMSRQTVAKMKARVAKAPAHCTVTMGRSVFSRLTNERASAKVKELAARQRAANCIPNIK